MRMQTLGIILTVIALVGGAVAVTTLDFSSKMLVGTGITAMVGWALIMLDPFYRKNN